MQKRAAIYARYSSDLQNARSVDDQVRLCEELAGKLGADVVETYTDHAISGAHAASRPGYQSMIEDGKAGRFDILIAEALDRLNRNQEHAWALYNRLAFADVEIHTVAEGRVDKIHLGLKGTMAEMFLDDLAQKVKRGHVGVLESGRRPAALPYGYRQIIRHDDAGNRIKGLWEIDPDQAEIVRRIFAEFAAGRVVRRIAADLDAEGIPSPRDGKNWSTMTIYGSRARRTGILNSDIYAGIYTWNRTATKKDPDSGRKILTTRPRSEWIERPAPDLRIVDEATWTRAQARLDTGRQKHTGSMAERARQREPRHVLSGKVRCGACGGNYTVSKAGIMACHNHRYTTRCDNARQIRIAEIEGKVLAALETDLLHPDVIDTFVREYHAARNARARNARARASRSTRRIAEIGKRISRLMDAVEAGADTPETAGRIRELSEEKRAAEADLKAAETPARVVEMHPNLGEIYRRRLDGLTEALARNGGDAEAARREIRELVDDVVITPREGRGNYDVEIRFATDALATLGDEAVMPAPPQRQRRAQQRQKP